MAELRQQLMNVDTLQKNLTMTLQNAERDGKVDMAHKLRNDIVRAANFRKELWETFQRRQMQVAQAAQAADQVQSKNYFLWLTED